MKVFALTGGIATGKSTVADFFSKLGAVVLNADKIAHQTYAPNTPLYQEMIKRYGPQILLANAEIDRKALAGIIFQNPEEKKWLEAKVHPLTRALIRQKVESLAKEPQKNPVVLVEAALHLENDYYKEFAGLIVVNTDEATQLKRLMARDGLSSEAAKRILRHQMPLSEKKKYAHWVIENSQDLATMQTQVEKLMKEFTK